MNPFNISEQEIDNILFVNGIAITGLTQSEKDNQVSELFNDPYQLIDFYIASHTDKEIFRDVTYTLDSINNLTDNEEEELAKIFLLNPDEENFIERLERILYYLDLIIEPFNSVVESFDLNIYGHIFYGAEYETIKNFCMASKSLKEYCSNNYFWENLLIQKYGNNDLIDPLNAEMTYLAKEIFEKYNPSKTIKDSITEILKGSEIVDIYWNITNENNMEAIVKVLKFNISLKELLLANNDIKGKEIKILMKALENNNSLQILTIYKNYIDGKGSKAISEMLKVNKSLKELYLFKNNIGTEGVKAITEALKVNTSLQLLNINYNNIGHEGAKAIAEALKFNKSLQRLNISSNNIGDSGAIAIAEALKFNISLEELDISYNNIGDDVKNMLKEVASNRFIKIKF